VEPASLVLTRTALPHVPEAGARCRRAQRRYHGDPERETAVRPEAACTLSLCRHSSCRLRDSADSARPEHILYAGLEVAVLVPDSPVSALRSFAVVRLPRLVESLEAEIPPALDVQPEVLKLHFQPRSPAFGESRLAKT